MRVRRLSILVMALGLAAFMPHERTAPSRWALVIGISDYTNFGAEIGGDLPGAAWDARRMRDVLVARWGYTEDHVRLLLDGEATRARIERELTEWLPSVVREGDAVVVFFAGHGSQTWDLNGDEPDGLDETLCPADVMKGDASADIADDELEQWLRRIPTRNLTVILDNCHSGTGTRAVTPFARPRSLARSVSSDLARPAGAPAAAAAVTPAEPGGGAAMAGAAVPWIEMAAAQADEVAVDAEWPGEDGAPPTYGGAFTTHLVRNLWRVPRTTSYREVFRLTVEDLKRERFAQRPLLTSPAPGDVPFAYFAGEASLAAAQPAGAAPDPAGAAVPVISTTDGIVLGGGAGAGMTAGSLYRAGSSLLRVSAVRASRAVAEVISGGRPAAGTSAVLVAQAYPRAVLRVSLADLDAATREALRQACAQLDGLVFTSRPQEFAHLLVRPAEAGWVILGMDGAQRHAIRETGPAGHKQVLELLARELEAQQLAALDNPGQAALPFSFAGGTTSFALGDSIAFEIQAPRAGYLTIVDLGTDGQVNVIYPTNDGEARRLAAGERLRLPSGEAAYEAQPPAGRGLVRAFLTDRPLGLSYREGGTRAAEVAAALRAAAGKAPAPAGASGRADQLPIPVDSWMTAALVYTIGRE